MVFIAASHCTRFVAEFFKDMKKCSLFAVCLLFFYSVLCSSASRRQAV